MMDIAPPLPRPSAGSTQVRGPTGRLITREDLPPADTVRWVPRRKAELVCALMAGVISQAEAISRYTLSIEELVRWTDLYLRFGQRGLMTTRTGALRQAIRRGA
jgi:hypothetical protein